jgi:hypothetical protein
MNDEDPPARSFLAAQMNERAYQRKHWTDPHDDTHTALEWGGLLARYVGRAVEAALTENRDLYAKSLTVIAAVAQAAFEADYRASASFLKDANAFVPEGAPITGDDA